MAVVEFGEMSRYDYRVFMIIRMAKGQDKKRMALGSFYISFTSP